jgi:hypothetical protein
MCFVMLYFVRRHIVFNENPESERSSAA